MEDYCIAAFRQTGDAIKALSVLNNRQLSPAIMPTPRSVSVSCGMSVRFRPQDLETVCEILQDLFPEAGQCLFFSAGTAEGHRVYSPISCADVFRA